MAQIFCAIPITLEVLLNLRTQLESSGISDREREWLLYGGAMSVDNTLDLLSFTAAMEMSDWLLKHDSGLPPEIRDKLILIFKYICPMFFGKPDTPRENDVDTSLIRPSGFFLSPRETEAVCQMLEYVMTDDRPKIVLSAHQNTLKTKDMDSDLLVYFIQECYESFLEATIEKKGLLVFVA